MPLKPLSKRVLVVEDEDAIRELIALRIDLAGHHAIPMKTGLDAIDHIRRRVPDAMILDVGLPMLDGFEVLQIVRNNGWAIPIMMMTARHATQDVERAIRLGACDYMTKPFDGRLFLQKLERLLKPQPVRQQIHYM